MLPSSDGKDPDNEFFPFQSIDQSVKNYLEQLSRASLIYAIIKNSPRISTSKSSRFPSSVGIVDVNILFSGDV